MAIVEMCVVAVGNLVEIVSSVGTDELRRASASGTQVGEGRQMYLNSRKKNIYYSI